MNSNSNHYFPSTIINIISKQFERIVLDKYKEPRDITDNDTINDTSNNNTNEDNSSNLVYNIEDVIRNNDNSSSSSNSILNNSNNSEEECDNYYGMQNMIDITQLNKINNSIICPPTSRLQIEDMIDIEEQEEEPMGCVIKKINTNNFEDIISSIPMASDIKQKKTKKQISEELKLSSKQKISIDELLSSVTKESNDKTKKDSSDVKDELKPISKYNLVDLQFMAKTYKIDTQKPGSCDKKINKLKSELYEEIKDKIKKF